ncbi:MAG TPA: hypothetical protein VGN20_12355 [Mucilaginibacter sp.]|jgi:hypothetical protein
MSKRSPKVGKSESPEVVKKSDVGDPRSESLTATKSETAKPSLTPIKNKQPLKIENPTSEINEPLTTHNSSLTNMEVHHHPEVEKKGFKEYLLEGLMIFIAVMMGFFAESLREHISEQQRAQEYATTLYSDLKADTGILSKYLKRLNYANANIDTLSKLLSASDLRDIPSGKLYFYGLFGGVPLQFASHDATLLEIKSSGSLRYFTKHKVNSLIAEYDAQLQYFKTIAERDQALYTEVRKLRASLFNFKYNDAANIIVQHNYIKFNQAPIDSFIKTNPPLLSADKIIFNQYVEMVRSRFLKMNAESANTLNRRAIELIGVLKKEYDLNDE